MSIPTPRATTREVRQAVLRRDFIPDGEPFSTAEETLVASFSRDSFDVRPDFIPDEDAEQFIAPVGDPDRQMAEAAALVKKGTAKTEREEKTGKAALARIDKLRGLNVGDTIAFLNDLSDDERAKYLDAEEASQKRSTVLRRYGRKA